jgi:hypothetical protein
MRRALTASIAAALAGALLLSIGLAVEPRQALFSYLAAWIFAASVCVGALLWVQMAYALNAGWMVVLRRRAEDIVGAFPAVAVLFVPVLLGLAILYPWARPEGEWDESLRDAVVSKRGWLSAPSFTLRAILFLGAWTLVGELLRRYSRAQDRAAIGALEARSRALAVATLPLVAFTLTFASFDWLMSLDPTWSSTVFGIYLFGGGFGGAVGLLCFVTFGPLSSRVGVATREHSHALGRIMLTFVIFWAYIAFAQYFLIWIADLPNEVGWIKLRTTGSWGALAALLASVHFVLPFFLLLSRELKRRPRALAWMGVWLVGAHYLDMYWVVLPNLHAEFHPHWLDLAALLFVSGTFTLVVLLRSRDEPEVPLRASGLAAGLRYEAS